MSIFDHKATTSCNSFYFDKKYNTGIYNKPENNGKVEVHQQYTNQTLANGIRFIRLNK